jgi:putative transposase
MPRLPRVNVPNGIYHVTARGNRRQPLFLEDRDRELFLAILATLGLRRRWRFHGYCLMPNHYHLVLTTPRADLSAGMHWLNSAYAHGFNEIHGLDGHLFQGRFHSISVEGDGHLLEVIRYVVLNPVRARLCVYPHDWPWSSYRPMRGGSQTSLAFDPRPPLKLFGERLPEARKAFGAFVADLRVGPRRP